MIVVVVAATVAVVTAAIARAEGVAEPGREVKGAGPGWAACVRRCRSEACGGEAVDGGVFGCWDYLGEEHAHARYYVLHCCK